MLFTLTTLPATKIATQLKTMKANPARIVGLSSTLKESTFNFRKAIEKPMPRPTSRLKRGPAKQAVIAMLPSPRFAMDMLVLRSPMLRVLGWVGLGWVGWGGVGWGGVGWGEVGCCDWWDFGWVEFVCGKVLVVCSCKYRPLH